MSSKQPSTMVQVHGIAAAVSELRDKTNWSRLEMAKRLGVSMTVLGVWETEKKGKAIYRGYNVPDAGKMRPFRTHRAFIQSFILLYKSEVGQEPNLTIDDPETD